MRIMHVMAGAKEGGAENIMLESVLALAEPTVGVEASVCLSAVEREAGMEAVGGSGAAEGDLVEEARMEDVKFAAPTLQAPGRRGCQLRALTDFI